MTKGRKRDGRLPRNTQELGSLELFARLDRGGPALLSDASRLTDVLHLVRSGLERSLANEARIYGWHSERMFGEVVKALAECPLIKDEDQGAAWGSEIAVPDFRVVLPTGKNLLVEVKNFYERNPQKPFPITSEYLNRLSQYAALANGQLKLAINWAFPGIWTLIDPAALKPVGAKMQIDLPTALVANEMGDVGDMMLATAPPLSVHMAIDEPVSRWAREPDGSLRATVRIKEASLWAAGRLLSGDDERLAWYLLMFCDWQERLKSVFDDEVLREVVLDYEPAEWDRDQGFASLGFLSQFFSRQYWLQTTKDGQIDRLHVDLDPGQAGFKLAKDHTGDLPLWRFRIQPRRVEDTA
jgi:hypothetical protein